MLGVRFMKDPKNLRDLGKGFERVMSPVNVKALALVDQLIVLTDENDRRRPLLYQLRNQIIEDGLTLQEARRVIEELESALDKVTSPANRIGTYLGSPKEGVAHVVVGGSEYYANVDPRIDISSLKVGTRILLNDAYAVVGDLGYSPSGPVGKVVDVLSDGRLRVGQEPGVQTFILNRSSDLASVSIRVGDEVRIDPNYRVAIERVFSPGAQDYYLEHIPEIPWSKIGGQREAIEAIRDAIEMPLLYPELFSKFNYSPPKGFLLYGPPGCGKTLIGKATAYNLTKQLREKRQKNVEQYFMHVKGPEILNMWLGESERMIREIFSRARERSKEGYLPFVFIDEAEAILGTRRAIRNLNIANTLVPMFCSELDGLESLNELVVILASNRPDLIDPAVLRPGRIDRKIKVKRPDRDACREIFFIYLTPDLPLDEKLKSRFGENVQDSIEYLTEVVLSEMWARNDKTKYLEIFFRSGKKEVLYWSDFASGAIIASIVRRAKEKAIKRSVRLGRECGISEEDLLTSLYEEYEEGEIFPTTDNIEDWMKLLDYDIENVAKVVPIRGSARKQISFGEVI
jgi:proteasome-associated ATPase